MVGLVLVSHSKRLAESVRDMLLQMTSPNFPVAVASGAGAEHEQLGTDAIHISETLQKLSRPDGLLVLMDLGSAVLSAEAALELLDLCPEMRIRLCAAPLVEGAIAAAVQANGGGSLEEVAREAERGLAGKEQQLKRKGDIAATLRTSSRPSLVAETSELVLTVRNEHGLHTRPAAALVRVVSKFASSVEIANMRSGQGSASARSLTSLALLEIRQGDQIRVLASGNDRDAALEAIRELADRGFDEPLQAASSPQVLRNAAATSSQETRNSKVGGIPGSNGISIGPLCVLEPLMRVPDDRPSGDPDAELRKLDLAMKDVELELSPEKHSSSPLTLGPSTEILEAQALILSDPALCEQLRSRLENPHTSAARAWLDAMRDLATQYQSMDDPYLRERSTDVWDIARRVLHRLRATNHLLAVRLDRPSIVFANELLPSEAVECDPATVLGVITREGSATSHSTILLRTLGIPAVLGASGIDEHAAGKTVALDGGTGEIWIEPDQQSLSILQARRQEFLERENRAKAERSRPSTTLDGERIEILANIGSAVDARIAAENGAEGVGLLRTESAFLQHSSAPSEEEQTLSLRQVFARIDGPIIVRTLDVGADKPLRFFPQREERNPYLGVRGIRLCLQSPALFLSQLRAILRSGVGHDIGLMFPMVSTVAEVDEALHMVDQAHHELTVAGRRHVWPIKRGAMIEVPAAALMSKWLAEKLDFFSIGTNDLTQYVMAAERGNVSLAGLQDSLHPALLHLIRAVIHGAKAHKRHVSVCGDAASDPLSAMTFVGLGVRSLSVRPKQVAEIKSLFRFLKMADLEQLAGDSLRCSNAAQVRILAKERLNAISNTNRNP